MSHYIITLLLIAAMANSCSNNVTWAATREIPFPLQNDSSTTSPSWFDLHFQMTSITQGRDALRAQYSGQNSLRTPSETAMSLTATLFFTARLWQGADLTFHPEIAGGEGLSGATGVAGFPNGETFRVGQAKPVLYPARLYLRQRFDFTNERDTISTISGKSLSSQNELFQKSGTTSHLTLVLGKFSAADFFDESSYSHDPRMQFLNWSLMSAGAWDYPADTRGYTIGAAAKWTINNWAFSTMFTMVPTTANGLELDTRIGEAFGAALQAEHHYALSGRKGIMRILAFRNIANAGTYRDAVRLALPLQSPDITQTRRYATAKFGFVLGVEQELSNNLGLFARASWNDGTSETWAFTEIDHSVCAGIQLDGNLWQRTDDVIGIASVLNGISGDHRQYLADGGYGFIIGDGALRYAPEWISEFYYRFQLNNWCSISADYQCVVNPAYNQDRGPVVHIGAVRIHVEF